MAVSVTCPGCRTSYPVTEDLLGKKIRCKKCQETFTATASRAPAGAGRTADERIQTRPGSAKAAAAARVDDDEDIVEVEDVTPRNGNGNGRAARQPAPTRRPQDAGRNKALLIGGGVFGVFLLASLGVVLWAMNRDSDDKPGGNDLVAGNNSGATLPIGPAAVTKTTTPPVEPAGDPAKVAGVDTSDTGSVSMKSSDEVPSLTIVKPRPRPANFTDEVVNRVKKSAVLIRVNSEEGLAYGSGWVAEKHGQELYIVTNSHVVGMKEPAKPPPEKIEIIFESGAAQERTLEGKLLGIDRDEDLAVIRVKGRDLPDPLPIAPSFDLQDTQKLLILGFPHGKFLEKELERGLGVKVVTTLKARQTTVAGRIFNTDHSVKYIQVEGGADPGNSGGAVVDTNGNVSAVLVAGDPRGNMRWVIPSEYVIHLLQGRILKVAPRQATKSGGIKQPLTAMIADPLKRLRQVTADVWAGKPGEVRPASDRKPQPREGDSPHATATLAYDPNTQIRLGESHLANGEFTLPPLQEGQVYWFRPHYVAKDGKERWGEAIVLEMGRYPVDAKPAHLAIKPKVDLRPDDVRRIELESREVFEYLFEGIGGNHRDQGLKASLTERTLAVDKNQDADVRLKYLDLHLGDEHEDTMFRKQLRGVADQVKNLAFKVKVTHDGRFTSPVPEWPLVSPGARPVLRRFNEQVMESLEAMSLGLPNKDVQPGDTWTHDTHYTFTVVATKTTQNALVRMTCKYVGTRVRDGREEAVIELTGRVVKDDNNTNGGGSRSPSGLSPSGGDTGGGTDGDGEKDEEGRPKTGFQGFARGAALVDVTTGLVTLSRTEADVAVVFPLTLKNPETNQEVTIRVHAGLYIELLLRRSLTKEAPKAADVAALLPNQVKAYNPLVGVGTAQAPSAAPSVIPERSTFMEPEAFAKVKTATVLVAVEGEKGQEGSGWFAEPGIVVTNAHVVGVLSKTSRPPEKITVVLNSGTEQQRKLTGKLLTVDRENDLAVVRVEGDNLPEPIPVNAAANLVETHRLMVLGFPRGEGLGKLLAGGLGGRDYQTTIKTRDTTLAGRVPDKDASVKYLQIEGGADAEGNSGSPVVDAKGAVRAVLVGGLEGSSMRFAAPAEYAARLVQGYPLEVEPGRAYLDGSTAKQPVTVRFSDPLKRVTKVALDYWVGSPGKPRKPSEKKPASAAGDEARRTVELAYDATKQTATGEFVLPSRAEGQVYWLQVRFTNGTGREEWARANPYAPDGPPVERRPVALYAKWVPRTQRDLEMTSYARFHYFLFDKEYNQGDPIKVMLTEHVLRATKQGDAATLNLEYKDLEFDFKKIFPQLFEEVPQLESQLRQLLKPFLSLIRGVVTVVRVDKAGNLKVVGVSYARLPVQAWYSMSTFNTQVITALQALTFPLPNQTVPYGHTWDFPTNLFIRTRNRRDPAVFNMKFKYVGVRDRGGRQEAVIEIEGSLAKDPKAKSIDDKELKDKQGTTPPDANPAPGEPAKPNATGFQATPPGAAPGQAKKGLYGAAHGYAYVDVAGGYVAEVKLYIDMDVEMMAKDNDTKQDVPVMAGGTMELLLKRLAAAGKPGT